MGMINQNLDQILEEYFENKFKQNQSLNDQDKYILSILKL